MEEGKGGERGEKKGEGERKGEKGREEEGQTGQVHRKQQFQIGLESSVCCGEKKNYLTTY